MTSGFPPVWAFLAIVFISLCSLGVFIAVLVTIFRAASKSSTQRSDQANKFAGAAVPPVLGDDSLTNPANPLYHLHHPSAPGHDAGSSHTAAHSFDSTPSPSPSFDSGSSASSSFDSGSASCGSTSDGSGCG